MKSFEITCPYCKHPIGVMNIKRIRKIVIYLLKHIEHLSELGKKELEIELEQLELEE